jgi:two-component system, NarL family, invasion response regulator UvrY
VNPLLQQLRSTIETLDCRQIETSRGELLTLVEALAAAYPSGNGDHSHRRLSPRESEVMTMILDGRRLKEIAANLDISVKTVTTHRSRLLRKLGLEDNLGLFRYGVRNGLIGV